MLDPEFAVLDDEIIDDFRKKFLVFFQSLDFKKIDTNIFMSLLIQQTYEIFESVEESFQSSSICKRERVYFLDYVQTLIDEMVKHNARLKNDSKR